MSVSKQHLLRIEADEAGQRVDRYLKRALPFVPHSLVHKWLRSGQVRLNGARVKADVRLSQDDTVRLPPQGVTKSVRTSEEVRTHEKVRAFGKKTLFDLQQRILLEKEDFFVLDKPAGLACQGGSRVTQALDQQLLALAERHPSLGVPRLVHRLDRATSGVLLVAKSRRAASDLARLFKHGKVRKTYCAILANAPRKILENNTATYTSPLADKIKGEQDATTHLFLLERAARDKPQEKDEEKAPELTPDLTQELTREKVREKALVLLRPISGRKHQLRRHMAEAGTSILGERLYPYMTPHATPHVTRSSQTKADKPARLMLHALRLVITDKNDPECGNRKRSEEDLAQLQARYALDIHTPPPVDFLATCEKLRLDPHKLKDCLFDPFV